MPLKSKRLSRIFSLFSFLYSFHTQTASRLNGMKTKIMFFLKLSERDFSAVWHSHLSHIKFHNPSSLHPLTNPHVTSHSLTWRHTPSYECVVTPRSLTQSTSQTSLPTPGYEWKEKQKLEKQSHLQKGKITAALSFWLTPTWICC